MTAAAIPGAPASRAPSLAESAVDRRNNFNLIRVTLAAMVLFHHGLVLTGNPVFPDSLPARLVAGMGEIAVGGFFIISGFLVTRSLFGRATILSFCAARILRIYPGLWVMLLLTTAFLAPFSELSASSYFASTGTWEYLAKNATSLFITYRLPGLFQDNPIHGVNGSLWSLRYEMLCYIALAIGGALGIAQRRWPVALVTLGLAASLVLIQYELPYIVDVGRHMGFLFGIGATAAAFAHLVRLRLTFALAALAIALLLDRTPLSHVAWNIAYGYLLLWIAYVPKGAILKFNRLPDISYGLYIYAFPVQQLLIDQGYGAEPLTNIAIALPVTILCATASWYLIEKPALRLKGRIGRRKDPRAADDLQPRSALGPPAG